MHVFPTGTTTMRSPLSIESQRRAYEEDPKWRAKAVLRIAATLTALIAIALFAASISYTDSGFTSTAGPEGDWTDGLALAPVIFALLYNSAVLIGHFGLRRGRPFHPSIYLALDLITWALTLPAVVVAVAGGIFWYWSDPVPSAGGHIDCTVFFNAFAMQCNPIVYTIGRMEIVGAVFMVFLLYV
jgi:hypothetical protein